MAVLFQLRGEGTAARRLAGQVQHFGDLGPGGLGKARPVHGGVGLGLGGVEQLAVFDKQQAVDHQWRDVGKGRVELLRVAELVQRGATAIGDRQARLDFLGIGHEQAVAGVVHQRVGEARLGLDQVIALEQPG